MVGNLGLVEERRGRSLRQGRREALEQVRVDGASVDGIHIGYLLSIRNRSPQATNGSSSGSTFVGANVWRNASAGAGVIALRPTDCRAKSCSDERTEQGSKTFGMTGRGVGSVGDSQQPAAYAASPLL